MTNRERSDWRDSAYSAWHRSLSDDLSFLDIDWMELCKHCGKLLALCELKVDLPGKADESYRVTKAMATKADVKGFLVLYTKQGDLVTRFRVKQIAPREEDSLKVLPPEAWAKQLYALRWCHPVEPPKLALVQGGASTHVCGFSKDASGVYRCIKDNRAVGYAPETACGVVWDGAV